MTIPIGAILKQCKCLALAMWLPLFGHAQQPAGASATVLFSLDECIAFALQNRQAIVEARLDQQSAVQDVRAILAMAHPQLSLSWDFNWFVAIPQQPVPAQFVDPQAAEDEFVTVQFGTDYNTSAGVQLNQLLFDRRFFLGLKAVRTLQSLQGKNLLRTEAEAIAEISNAYYTVLVSQRRLELLQANMAQTDNLLQTTRGLNQSGFAEDIDVARLEVARNNLATQFANAQAMVSLTNDLLKFQMGMDPEITLALTDTLDVEGFDASALNPELTANPEMRPEYQLLETQLKLEWYNERRHMANYWPALYAVGLGRAQTFANDFGNLYALKNRWFPQAIVGLNFNWTIYDGFANAANAQKSRIAQLKIRSQQENFIRAVALETQQARTNLQNALRILASQAENLKLAQEVQRVVRLKYTEGVGANLEVQDAQTQLSTAQTNFADALLQAYLARVDLLRATGRILDDVNRFKNLEVDMTR